MRDEVDERKGWIPISIHKSKVISLRPNMIRGYNDVPVNILYSCVIL